MKASKINHLSVHTYGPPWFLGIYGIHYFKNPPDGNTFAFNSPRQGNKLAAGSNAGPEHHTAEDAVAPSVADLFARPAPPPLRHKHSEAHHLQ